MVSRRSVVSIENVIDHLDRHVWALLNIVVDVEQRGREGFVDKVEVRLGVSRTMIHETPTSTRYLRRDVELWIQTSDKQFMQLIRYYTLVSTIVVSV